VMVNVGRQTSTIEGCLGSETKSTVNSSSTLDLIAGSHNGRLILCRIDNRFYAYRYLDNETDWVEINSVERSDFPTNVQVGMIANGYSGPDLFAAFDYIRLRQPTSVAGCTSD